MRQEHTLPVYCAVMRRVHIFGVQFLTSGLRVSTTTCLKTLSFFELGFVCNYFFATLCGHDVGHLCDERSTVNHSSRPRRFEPRILSNAVHFSIDSRSIQTEQLMRAWPELKQMCHPWSCNCERQEAWCSCETSTSQSAKAVSSDF